MPIMLNQRRDQLLRHSLKQRQLPLRPAPESIPWPLRSYFKTASQAKTSSPLPLYEDAPAHTKLNNYRTYNDYARASLHDYEYCAMMLDHELLTDRLVSNVSSEDPFKDVDEKKKFYRNQNEFIEKTVQKCKNYSVGESFSTFEVRNAKGTLMKQLASREFDNKMSNILSIIYILDVDERNHDVAAFLDFKDRLLQEDWTMYFSGQQKLKPKFTDLCYYNLACNRIRYTDSPNFKCQVSNDGLGFRFLCKVDFQPIYIMPEKSDLSPCLNVVNIVDPQYKKVIIYDHIH